MADDQWVMLVDPAWEASAKEGPPPEAVVGGWLARADGSVAGFRPNPGYEPSGPGSPTDALDAVLGLVARGEVSFDRVASVFPQAGLSLAVDEQSRPLVAPSPDGVSCLLVTTAPTHRRRVRAAGWLDVTPAELGKLLGEQAGVDLLLNPGAVSCTRLPAETVQGLVRE